MAVDSCLVTTHGLQGDYNHYRAVALQNTPDRAVSLWTQDCCEWLQQQEGYPVQPGDLGENMFLQGPDIAFDDFAPGVQLQLRGGKDTTTAVVLEITEPVIPCANLCKLPYINDESKTPSQRIQTCQAFLQVLGQFPGLRGWYAKVITPGQVHVNDVVHISSTHNSSSMVSSL